MWTSYERKWQNDPLFDGNNAIVTYSDDILKALIEICTKLFLIQAQIPQVVLFDSRISIHNVFLPQSATSKQCNAINVSMLKSITIKFDHCHIESYGLLLLDFANCSLIHIFTLQNPLIMSISPQSHRVEIDASSFPNNCNA